MSRAPSPSGVIAAVSCALLLSPVLVRPIGAAPDANEDAPVVETVEIGTDGVTTASTEPPSVASSTPLSPRVSGAPTGNTKPESGYLLRSTELPSLAPPEPMIGGIAGLTPPLVAGAEAPGAAAPTATSSAATSVPATVPPTSIAPTATTPAATAPPTTVSTTAVSTTAVAPTTTGPPVTQAPVPVTEPAPAAEPPPVLEAAPPEAQVAAIALADPAVSDAPGEYVGVFEVTCYALGGNTASGAPVSTQGVAVDPAVLPLGTNVYLDGLGWHTATDTGGGVNGNHIDIWRPTDAECISWGRRNLDVWRKVA